LVVNRDEQSGSLVTYPLSNQGRGHQKSCMFFIIDQRQEHVGSEITSSSEDG
jgi:hypothetical protein